MKHINNKFHVAQALQGTGASKCTGRDGKIKYVFDLPGMLERAQKRLDQNGVTYTCVYDDAVGGHVITFP